MTRHEISADLPRKSDKKLVLLIGPDLTGMSRIAENAGLDAHTAGQRNDLNYLRGRADKKSLVAIRQFTPREGVVTFESLGEYAALAEEADQVLLHHQGMVVSIDPTDNRSTVEIWGGAMTVRQQVGTVPRGSVLVGLRASRL